MKKFGKLCLMLFMLTSILVNTNVGVMAKTDKTATSETKGEGELLQEIIDRGELIVGTSPDFPPNEFIDPNKSGQDQYVGSDIDFAKYIAEQLGVKLTIKAMDFDAVLTSLSTGRIDMAITGITKTPERLANMEMSDSYYDEAGDASKQGLLILNKDKDKYKKLSDLSGKTVAVQAGSLQDYYASTQLTGIKVQYIAKLNDGIELLKNGNVDAIASAYGTGQEFQEKNDDLYMGEELLFKLNPEYMGTRVGVPKGETALVNKVNEIIKKVNAEGLYEEWYQSAKNYDKNKIEGSFFDKTVKIAEKYWPQFMEGLGITLGLAFVTVLFGTVFGAIFALIKLSKNKIVQCISGIYVEIIRGTPLLLQLWFFVVLFGSRVPVLVSVIVALVVNSSAYVAEIIRGGILSVDKGQREAAKSLGMSDTHMMIKIILPQATKNILPALGNEFIMMVKETSLASTFYIGELMSVNNIIKTATYMNLEPLMIAGIIYFVVTFTLSKLVKMMERRMSVSD